MQLGRYIDILLCDILVRYIINYILYEYSKWHLGFQSWEYTPTFRGFDTFAGYWNGVETYYTHEFDCDGNALKDLRINEDIADGYDNIYGPFWERDRMLELLNDLSKKDDNFFIYAGFQASHTPSEAPEEFYKLYDTDNNTKSEKRKCNQAQTSSLDHVVEVIINYMKKKHLWDNTLLLFISDNGGEYFVCFISFKYSL